ncbi:SDR family oxidoreductase [Leptospira ognonensis]|uniref:SDR family oxidoreductase n=1 Tax=Leptospira ognonensis TaxID=2484945 RepID=A0A4R9K2Z6_9LEPT|nr:SDR family oxidoreductase [Leptospira ognonensis]TGL59234.1 SDR family oxidoreductase [Leptospira ognonensis]
MSKIDKLAIVTGASRGIGLALVKSLIALEYKVVGCSRNPELCDYKHQRFQLDKVDLADLSQLEAWITKLKTNASIDLLIHNVGVGFFAPLEELNWKQINSMITLHLTVPMLLTNSLLRELKKSEGRLIFIGSVAGTKISPWGSVYGATKAGLIHFGREVFQELRKSGVKVTNIIPDMTDTEFYKDLTFDVDEDPKAYILDSCVSQAIENILSQREGTIISEIVIQPEKFKIRKK